MKRNQSLLTPIVRFSGEQPVHTGSARALYQNDGDESEAEDEILDTFALLRTAPIHEDSMGRVHRCDRLHSRRLA